MSCPRRYWFQYLCDPKPPTVVDLPRLFGSFMHQHAERMHTKTKCDRPMYYQTLKSAVKAGYFFWRRSLEENLAILQPYTQQDLETYQQLVAICVTNYWKVAVERPRPLHIEWRLEANWNHIVKLLGFIDQVREVDLATIERLRPELIVDGKLHPDFDPVVLVDLKTNRASYSPWKPEGQTATVEEWARKQFPLHAYEQPTAYTWLYHEATGKWPIAFVWWHLRSGKMYPTYRTKEDIDEFGRTIDHVIDNLTALSFPRNVGSQCAYCDFFRQCRGRDLLIADPATRTGDIAVLPQQVVLAEARQLRLPLRVERRQVQAPEAPAAPNGRDDVIYIGDPPWLS
ncbi:PD-(D/E)XK nuclease family protein [candidate division WWE3 bacterium]|uniref:PD-(D/E)XK nuclease family protein n=1 Tax=candidate division WWE3 bacterium TaxID=2053526 RepID=A0A955LKX5_UNCKA|nr:PD-(D/E)XK nuclease family protein [candidate division WWE3 bacterium]